MQKMPCFDQKFRHVQNFIENLLCCGHSILVIVNLDKSKSVDIIYNYESGFDLRNKVLFCFTNQNPHAPLSILHFTNHDPEHASGFA
jgi:hypothetical protein